MKHLTQAGMPEAQAEVLAEYQFTLIDEKLATRQDLKEREPLLTRDIEETGARLSHNMKEMEARLSHNIEEMGARLSHTIEEIGTRLSHNIKETGARLTHTLTIRLGSMLAIAFCISAALLKFSN